MDFGLAKMGPAIQVREGTMTMALTSKGRNTGNVPVHVARAKVTGQDAEGPRSNSFRLAWCCMKCAWLASDISSRK